jgi:putative tryptophan/tyrosine transport system substrate-binding protein
MAINRRHLLGAAVATAAAPTVGWAQSNRAPLVAAMIGARGVDDPAGISWANAVLAGLVEQGWTDGVNVRVEVRFTAGEAALTAEYAAELLALGPDVFITGTTPNAVEVHRLTKTIPIVFVAVTDPIAAGLVENYPRPEGNVTGITHLEPSVGSLLVDILIEIAPATSRIVHFTNPDTNTLVLEQFRPYVIAAVTAHGAEFSEVLVRTIEEIAPAIDGIPSPETTGIVVTPNNWIHNNYALIVEAIDRHRIPAIYSAHRMVDGGGLVSVGVETADAFQIAGGYAGRILRGASPAELPVRVAPFSTWVNLQTAARQGITIPISILATADRVIE